MILSDTEIQHALSLGDIRIDPFDEQLLKAGSYVFTLEDTLFRQVPRKEIDGSSPRVEHETLHIPDDGFSITPGDFLLGHIHERLGLCPTICGFLDARTTLARIGLNVLQGSTFIQPGNADGQLTLEITNVGPSPVRVHAGMKIVKGIFARVGTPAHRASHNGSHDYQRLP